jgi:hypothetical protein
MGFLDEGISLEGLAARYRVRPYNESQLQVTTIDKQRIVRQKEAFQKDGKVQIEYPLSSREMKKFAKELANLNLK